jgi:hypothetical protein
LLSHLQLVAELVEATGCLQKYYRQYPKVNTSALTLTFSSRKNPTFAPLQNNQ